MNTKMKWRFMVAASLLAAGCPLVNNPNPLLTGTETGNVGDGDSSSSSDTTTGDTSSSDSTTGDGDGDGTPGDMPNDPCSSPQSFTIPNMCDLTSLEGDAFCFDDGAPVGISLTAGVTDSIGGVYFAEVLPLGGSFNTKFSFEIRNAGGLGDDCMGGPTGGDGLAFVISGSPVLGEGGAYTGITGSVAVEVDTWCNAAFGDPSSNHVGIMLDGDVEHFNQPAADIPFDFEDGSVWWVWIDYDGTTIDVYVGPSDVKPGMPDLSRDVDVAAVTGGSARWVGFMGSNGLAWENVIVRSWEFDGSC